MKNWVKIAVLAMVLVCVVTVAAAGSRELGAESWVVRTAPQLELRAVVTWIDWEADEVIVAAEDGTIWAFYGTEEWCLFDTCVITINTNMKTDIRQWEIEEVVYTGWINPFEE